MFRNLLRKLTGSDAPPRQQRRTAAPRDFPVVQGVQVLADGWILELPEPMKRRVEDGQLVFWRPGLTAWLHARPMRPGVARSRFLEDARKVPSPRAYGFMESESVLFHGFAYRLEEPGEGGRIVRTIHGMLARDESWLTFAIYFDDEDDYPRALDVFTGLSAY